MVASSLRELVEERTGPLLLIAGGFLSVQVALNAIPDLVGFSLRARLPAWAGYVFSSAILGFVGIAMPFVVLLGLYWRLNSETPRVAAVGGALMALTPILFSSGALAGLVLSRPDPVVLLWLSPIPYALGVGLFALTFLRRDGSVRFVGVPLLAFSATWILTYAVGLRTGGLPEQFPFIESLAISVIATGYLLSTRSASPDTRAPAGG